MNGLSSLTVTSVPADCLRASALLRRCQTHITSLTGFSGAIFRQVCSSAVVRWLRFFKFVFPIGQLGSCLLIMAPVEGEDKCAMKRLTGIVARVVLWSTVTSLSVSVARAATGSQAVPGIVDIDSRQRLLEIRLSDAVESGRLGTAQSDEIKRLLDGISLSEAQYLLRDRRLKPWECLKLNLDLDHVSKTLESKLGDRQLASMDIAPRVFDITVRLAEAARNGRLTRQELADLRQKLQSIAALDLMSRSDGAFSYIDALTVSLALDGLSSDLERLLDERQLPTIDLDKSLSELDQKIAAGVESGKLSNDVAESLRADLKKFAGSKQELQGSLAGQKALSLAIDLEQFEDILDQKLSGKSAPDLDIQTLTSQLDSDIAKALVDGRLSPPEALRLQSELNCIVAHKAELAAGKPELSQEDKQALGLELEVLAVRLQRTVHGPRLAWPGIDSFQAGLDQRIASAVQAKRLTRDEASTLLAQADVLAAKEKELRAQQATSQQMISLTTGLEVLAAKLYRQMQDRPFAAPDIDARQKELDRRLSAALDQGKISSSSAFKIKSELEAVNDLKKSYLSAYAPAGSGIRAASKDTAPDKKAHTEMGSRESSSKTVVAATLTNRQKLIVGTLLERAAAHLSRSMNGAPESVSALEQRQKTISDRLTEGFALGRLDEPQWVSLKAELDQIASQAANYRQSQDGLTAAQALSLSDRLDTLGNKLEQQLLDSFVTVGELDLKRRQLSLSIGEALACGRLTIPNADSLQKDLEAITQAEILARASSGSMSFGEALKIDFELTRLNNRLARQARQQPLALADVDMRLSAIENQIAGGLASGRLSLEETKRLKYQLDRIGQINAKYRSSGGGSSYAETLTLTQDLDRLGHTVLQQMRDPRATLPDINQRQAQLIARIKESVSAGKLSAGDAQELRENLDRIEQSEASFRVSDEGLNFWEAVTLVGDLDGLSARIDRLTHKAAVLPDLDGRRAQLQQRLTRELAAGKISPHQALRLRKEIKRIALMEVAFRNSPSGLSPQQAMTLSSELDKLGAGIKQPEQSGKMRH